MAHTGLELIGFDYRAWPRLAGAVLEDGFRRIAPTVDVKVSSRDDLSALNNKFAKRGIYNRLTQKKLRVWIDIRNNADHAKFDAYISQDVRAMFEGVRSFLSDFMH